MFVIIFRLYLILLLAQILSHVSGKFLKSYPLKEELYHFTLAIFTIVPETQHVYLNHNVTFECATNLTGYTLSFSYGGSITVILKQTNLPSGGIIATATFMVTSVNNGTSVRCIADDKMNITLLTSFVYAYAQG